MTTSEQHMAAVLAIINANLNALSTPRHAYDLDDAPTSGADYVEATIHRRFGGNPRMGGRIAPSGWRLTTRAVGSTVTNARLLLARVTEALEDVRVTVAGETSTPIAFETETPVEQDDAGTWSGLRSWTWTF